MTSRAQEEWSRRVVAEYKSAAVAAELVQGMIRAAFPEHLIQATLQIVSDELVHARLSHDVLVSIGGPDAPIQLSFEALGDGSVGPSDCVVGAGRASSNRRASRGSPCAAPSRRTYLSAMRKRYQSNVYHFFVFGDPK